LNQGEILLLAGPSGSGKSTLSYAINGIIPFRFKGFMKGEIKIFNKNLWDYDFIKLNQIVGLVKQNPLEQLVTFTVRDEIAFGLENLKYPVDEIESKINEVASFMGIDSLLERNIDQLSGGQKQLTILSSFLVLNPKILILDEPIAFLDQNSESILLERLKILTQSKKFNLTIILIEHRLSRVLDIADKVLILDENGKIFLNGSVSEILREKFERLRASNVRVPWISDLFYRFQLHNHKFKSYDLPINFENLIQIILRMDSNDLSQLKKLLIEKEIMPNALKNYENKDDIIKFQNLYITSLKNIEQKQDNSISIEKSKPNASEILLEVNNLSFEYPNSGIKALKDLSFQVFEGDFIGLVGPNGSGKTTLLYLLANLYQPTSGYIYFKGKNLEEINAYDYAKYIGFIFQNPENMIFKSSIKDEILYGPQNFGIQKDISEGYLQKLINLIGNENPDKNPFHLSWGQKRRLNLSSIFVYNPDLILLDEPFIGQDQHTIDSLIETLFIENKRGKTIIISSHDYHLLLKYTRRIMELNKNGTIKDYGMKENYFKKHSNLGPIILLEKINQLIKEGV